MESLPDWTPVNVTYIKCPRDYVPKPNKLGVMYPEISKFTDGRLVLDWYRDFKPFGKWIYPKISKLLGKFRFLAYSICYKPGPIYLKVWRKEDHPNLKLLPENIPKVIKRLYRAEFQLNLLRSTDALPMLKAFEEARKALLVYNKNKKGKRMNDNVDSLATKANDPAALALIGKTFDGTETEFIQTPEAVGEEVLKAPTKH